LLDPGNFVRSMLLGESCDATVWELLDPMGRLPHPVLDGDGKARASSVAVEDIPVRAFFGRKGSAVVDKACSEKLEFFSLGVPFPGPLLLIRLVLALALFKGADEAACEVGDCVHVVCHLHGGRGSTGQVDGS
jgi:hypothetical protein